VSFNALRWSDPDRAERVILACVEAGAAVIASLDEVLREAGYSEARAAGHGVGERTALSSLFAPQRATRSHGRQATQKTVVVLVYPLFIAVMVLAL